jgi:N-acetylglucosamine kinase-like BadF-type ATPase
MEEFFLGIDAGGTKCHALITDSHGNSMGFGKTGASNPDMVGHDGFQTALEEALSQALANAGIERGQISGAGFGVAGYDWHSQKTVLLDSISPLNLSCPVELVNDAIIALLAGATKNWGVAVVAGTSCNARGIGPDGSEGRVSGYSWLGEAAGSFELVSRALEGITKAWSMRGPETKLTNAFIDLIGADSIEDLIEKVSLREWEIDPAAASLVFEVANTGDEVANELIRWAGASLGDLVLGVIRQLGNIEIDFDVVLAGNFFKGSPIIQVELERVVLAEVPLANIVALKAPPVIGGVLIGMRGAGLSIDSISSARNQMKSDFLVDTLR